MKSDNSLPLPDMEQQTSIPMELVELEDGFHLMINVTVNNSSVKMLIDTGASLTCFDSTRILHIPGVEEDNILSMDKNGTGLGTNTMSSAYTELENIKIGDIELTDYPVIVINMQHVNDSYEKLGIAPIDGVIGSEFLLKHKAIIDYNLLEIRLYYKKYEND